MKLYCIIRSKKDIQNMDTYNLLKSAAEARGIEFVDLESDILDYSVVEKSVDNGSILYRIAGGSRASLLESIVFPQVVTLKKNIGGVMSRSFAWGSAIRLQHAGLPIIPTIYNISKLHDKYLKKYVASLGGFPVILKSAGGSHGAGVMKIDSIESLRSVLDFITDSSTGDLVMRQYISNARHLRVVVLGQEVLDVIEYKKQAHDFRTNAVQKPEVTGISEISEDIKRDAIKAVSIQDLEFGGVDILIDEKGNYFIAEVNHPCNFARNQLSTGVDIAGAIVDYLVEKHAGKVEASAEML